MKTNKFLPTESVREGFLYLTQAADQAHQFTPANEEETEALHALELRSWSNEALYTEFHCIHGERPTLNNTIYPNEILIGNGLSTADATGFMSWTHPYETPLIKNHWQAVADPFGRCCKAAFALDTEDSNSGVIAARYRITDEGCKQKVVNGEYLTSSIGGKTEAAYCTICGADLLTEEGYQSCDHERGKTYDGVIARLSVGPYTNLENSFVNVPADRCAGVIRPAVQVGLGEEMFSIGRSLTERLNTVYVGVNGLKPSKAAKESAVNTDDTQEEEGTLPASTETNEAETPPTSDSTQENENTTEDTSGETEDTTTDTTETDETTEDAGTNNPASDIMERVVGIVSTFESSIARFIESVNKLTAHLEATQSDEGGETDTNEQESEAPAKEPANKTSEESARVATTVAKLQYALGRTESVEDGLEKIEGLSIDSLKEMLLELAELKASEDAHRIDLLEKTMEQNSNVSGLPGTIDNVGKPEENNTPGTDSLKESPVERMPGIPKSVRFQVLGIGA